MLEVTFDPLTLCTSVSPLFTVLSQDESYVPYLPLLQRALLSRLLSQLAQVYSTLKMSKLLDLLQPLRESAPEGKASTFEEEQVEAYIMGCARVGELNVRVDHADGSLEFVDQAFVGDADLGGASSSSAESTVQDPTSTVVRTRLSAIARTLHNSLLAIEPVQEQEAMTPEEQQAKVAELVAAAQTERKALQLRRALVARRRELLSELSVRKEKEEASRRAETMRRERETEGKRALDEVRKRELERARKEIENIRTEEARKLAQSLKERGNLKVDIDVSVLLFFSFVLSS